MSRASQVADLLRVSPLTALFLAGLFIALMSGLSVWLSPGARRRRHRRYRRQAAGVLAKLPQLAGDGQRLNYLRKINPYVFEELLLLAFERRGYPVKRNRSYSGDGGLDGQVFIAGQRWLVQAKRYSRAVDPAHVAAFGELLAREQVPGFFIHTGRTGPKSYRHGRQYPAITIISGQKLLALLLPGDTRPAASGAVIQMRETAQ